MDDANAQSLPPVPLTDTCGRLRYLYIDTAVFTPTINSNRQGVILFTLYTILKFMYAKVIFNLKII